jgi:hypothetical protein
MINDFRKIGLVVVDVCDPKLHYQYHEEPEINDSFVNFLNVRLGDLKKRGSKIIEVNYLETTHPLLTTNFDFSTTDQDEFKKYVIDEKLKHLVYCGFHYGVCIHRERQLSAYTVSLKKYVEVSISPFLTRPLFSTYGTRMTVDDKNLVFDILL